MSSLTVIFLALFYISIGVLFYTDIKLLAKGFEMKLFGKSLRLALIAFYILSLVLVTYILMKAGMITNL